MTPKDQRDLRAMDRHMKYLSDSVAHGATHPGGAVAAATELDRLDALDKIADRRKRKRTRSDDIREILAEGPATTHEVALALEITQREAHVGVWVLAQMGHAKTTGRFVASDCGGKARNIYELTAHGRRMLAIRRTDLCVKMNA